MIRNIEDLMAIGKKDVIFLISELSSYDIALLFVMTREKLPELIAKFYQYTENDRFSEVWDMFESINIQRPEDKKDINELFVKLNNFYSMGKIKLPGDWKIEG